MPAVLAVVLGALYVWVHQQALDSIELRTLNEEYLRTAIWQHVQLTVVSTCLALIIGLLGGVSLTRPFARFLAPGVVAVANLGQATPAIGLLVLLTLVFGIGFNIAIVSLVAYSVLPILRNTIVGIRQVDGSLIEAARGVGMSGWSALLQVELPLAVPVILAGVRTALVLNVGVATLATFVNAGGLGDIIVNGIKLQRTPVLITGSVITASLALFVDWIGGMVERNLRPRGI